MKETEYLYGENVNVPEIPYGVINQRIALLNKHLTELLSVHYTKRDAKRVSAVVKAIDFWDKLNNS